MSAQRGERGFTLIELLVSLAILGMFGSMLVAVLGKTTVFLARSGVQSTSEDRANAAQMMLRAKLQQIRAITRDNSSTPLVDMNGTATSLTFFAPALDRAAPDALWRYRLTATAAGDLVLYWASSLDDRYDFASPENAGWQPITLLQNVKALNITYFGSEETGPARRWQTRWIARAQPPELVRVRVQFDERGYQRWPDLIARPRATVNTACSIDPLTATCRKTPS